VFESYYPASLGGGMFFTYTYTGPNNFVPGTERVHINYWVSGTFRTTAAAKAEAEAEAEAISVTTTVLYSSTCCRQSVLVCMTHVYCHALCAQRTV
jgi:hypothetical protein